MKKKKKKKKERKINHKLYPKNLMSANSTGPHSSAALS